MKLRAPVVAGKIENGFVIVSFDGTPHLCFRRSDFRAFQTWREDAIAWWMEAALSSGANMDMQYDTKSKLDAVVAEIVRLLW